MFLAAAVALSACGSETGSDGLSPGESGSSSAEASAVTAHRDHETDANEVAAAPSDRLLARTPEGWGSIAVSCTPTSRAADDPILHYGKPGASHLHDFYAATAPGAESTADELVAGSTTCDLLADRSAYWHPVISVGETPISAKEVVVYYRRAPSAPEVEDLPFGLQLIGGLQPGTTGYTCGALDPVTTGLPTSCPESDPLRMHIAFPDCWDGTLAWNDGAHAAFSNADRVCPSRHPRQLPEFEIVIRTGLFGTLKGISIDSGSLDSLHADALFAWVPGSFEVQRKACLDRLTNCETLAVI